MEEFYKDGRIKALGVCNFSIKPLEFLLEEAEIKPTINQIELHPQYQQKEIQNFCKTNNIVVSSWASLQYGKVCYNETIIEIANRYNKTPAQIVLRWHIQNGHMTVTRSTKKERLEQNINIFDFELTNEDMAIIDNMDSSIKPIWPCLPINENLN